MTEAIEYIRENTHAGWLSADAVKSGELRSALTSLLGEPIPAGYMSEAYGWRVHDRGESIDDDERALAAAVAAL